jgi:hypothetical protein
MVATRVDIEEIESTKSEKALAVVLAAFVLMGGGWLYARIDDSARSLTTVDMTARERAAMAARAGAERQLGVSRQDRLDALRRLTLAREDYRTALEAGRPAAALRRRYLAARSGYTAAAAAERAAVTRLAPLRTAAARAERAFDARRSDADRERELLTVGGRLALVSALLASGFWLLARLRRAGSRYLPVGIAVLGAGTALALLFVGDEVSDYVDPLDLGLLVLSLAGIAASLAAYAALQRYLARRLPLRRVRRGECIYCGFPQRDRGPHCERCGREVVAPCAECGQPRRVGALHCAACGRA